MNFSGPVTLASRNDGKRREFEVLADGALSLVLLDPEAPPVVEDGVDYFANALKKARAAARFTGGPALADDSGLEVDALGGRPGVHSARYGGPGLDDAARTARLLDDLGAASDRAARFRCVLVLVSGEEWISAEGILEGEIAHRTRGHRGFGYDPIFVPTCLDGPTLAEVKPEQKNRISHRAVALRALLAQV